jgi:hypothetical protein
MRQGPRHEAMWVVGAAAGSKKLRVCWGYVYFDTVADGKKLWGPVLIQTFLCCCRHKGFVRSSDGVKCLDGDAQCGDERLR